MSTAPPASALEPATTRLVLRESRLKKLLRMMDKLNDAPVQAEFAKMGIRIDHLDGPRRCAILASLRNNFFRADDFSSYEFHSEDDKTFCVLLPAHAMAKCCSGRLDKPAELSISKRGTGLRLSSGAIHHWPRVEGHVSIQQWPFVEDGGDVLPGMTVMFKGPPPVSVTVNAAKFHKILTRYNDDCEDVAVNVVGLNTLRKELRLKFVGGDTVHLSDKSRAAPVDVTGVDKKPPSDKSRAAPVDVTGVDKKPPLFSVRHLTSAVAAAKSYADQLEVFVGEEVPLILALIDECDSRLVVAIASKYFD